MNDYDLPSGRSRRASSAFEAAASSWAFMTAHELQPARALELAIVIPTFNERANVVPLLDRLRVTLAGIEWEAIFVDDDSPDHTAAYIREIARTDARVRVLQRIGRRGLASACIEGMLLTPAPFIAVMDADLQHDEAVLPRMYQRITSEKLDIVVGSRNVEGGSMGEFAKERVMLSTLGKRLSRSVAKCDLSDPMSGFFIVDRRFFEEVVYRLSGVGFKILVDLVASSQRPVRFAEVPYTFRNRERGESKLDINVGLEYLELLLDKVIGHVVPTRFVLFVMVGAVGLLVHLGVLAILFYMLGKRFSYAQGLATLVAMTFNFLVNNITTFRARRLRGSRLISGLLIYYVACSVGAMTNLSFAEFLLNAGLPWYLAGILGMAVSSVWNYGVNTILTWRRTVARTV
jgi:dolichol-phosphate mannosyltransferase